MRAIYIEAVRPGVPLPPGSGMMRAMVVEHLERAADAIDRTPELALGELLAAWRACRDERIAGVIDEVSARIQRPRPAGKRVTEKQKLWLALADAGDPADVGVLLATLTDLRKAEPLSERIARLAQRPADPRIAAAFVKLAVHPPIPGSTGIPPLREALTAAIAIGDPRSAPEFARVLEGTDAVGAGMSRWYIEHSGTSFLDELRAAIATPIDAAAAAVLDRIRAHLAEARPARAVRGGADELFAAVYARPDDDQPRAVLADYLQECGDPRGEFIALQLARARGGPRTKREGELLRASGRDWLGAIEPLVLKSKLAFERGFVARCAVRNDAAAVLDQLGRRPEWATVTDVDVSAIGYYSRTFVAQMPALRALRGTEVAHLPQEHATLAELDLKSLDASAVTTLAALDGFGALRRLTIGSCWAKVAELEPLWKSPLAGRLQSFTADFWEIESWIPRVLELPIGEIAISRRSHDPWGIRFVGDTAHFEFLWSFTKPTEVRYFERVPGLLALLPASRIKKVVFPPAQLPAEVTAALARFA